MEENSLPPGQTVPPSLAPDSLDGIGANVPVSHLVDAPKQYPLETLEVHAEGSSNAPQAAFAPALSSVPFSRRRAAIVSLVITLIVILITGASAAFILKKQAPDDKASSQLDVPLQDVSVGEASPSLPELEGVGSALLVNGDIIARGNLEIVSGDFTSVMRTDQLSTNQTLTLPDASGEVCLDVNNCNFATQAEIAADAAQIDQQAAELAQQAAALADLQAQLNQIVIPPAGVTSLNDQAGAVSIQGTLNRVSVSTANGVITLTTPQDLDANANVQFGNLTLGTAGSVSSNTLQQTAAGNNLNINAGSDSIVFTATGRTYTFPNSGAASQTICTSIGNCGGGGSSVTDVNGETGSITLQGTTDQVVVSTGSGTITFSTPQNINTTSSPTFAALTLTGLGSGNLRVSGGVLTVGAINLATEVSGTLGIGNGGTGLATTPTNGQLLIGNGTNYTLGTLNNNGGLAITNGAGSIGLAVNYGALANTAVQGNTALTCPSGAGNLTGGGTVITLGAGGTCSSINIVDNPTFSTSVTTPELILTGAGSDGTLEVASLGQATTFTLPDPGQATADICLSTGNCAGSGGGVTTSGGTTNRLAVFTGSQTIGDSWFIQNSSTLELDNTRNLSLLGGNLSVTGTTTSTGDITSNTQLRVLESTGATFYGILDVGDLGSDQTFTFLQGGTVVTSGNVSTFATTGVTAGGGLTGGGTTGVLSLDIGAGNGIQVNANDVAVLYGSTANTAVQGNTQITVTAGTNLTGGGTITLGAGGSVTVNVSDDPTFAGDVVIQGGSATLGADAQQGTLLLYDGGTGGAAHIGTLQVVSTLGQATVYTLPDPGQATANICLSTGNCAGAGSGVTTSGGTTNRVSKFTGSQNIEDSSISDDGSLVTVNGNVNLAVQGTSVTVGVGSSRTGSVVLQNSTNNNTVTLQSGVTGTSYTLTLPTAVGGANQCLKAQDGTGTLFWDNCLGGGGGGGITSIDGQTGPSIAIDNATGAGNVITIDNAAADGTTKGIAAFNATNFTASSGVINTIQDIATSSSPQFVGLTLTGDLAVNGGDITSTGALNITPGGTLTVGATAQSLFLQGSATSTWTATDAGNTTTIGFTTPVADTTLNFPALSAGTYEICTSNGNCAGAGVTLQAAYNNSSTPEIVVDATRGALTIRDASTPIGANLLEVQNNAGSTTYLAVTASGVSVTGTTTSTGNINSSAGALQTGGTTRIDNSGNATNIGNVSLSGSISGGTTYSGSGNINTTGGVLQTNSTTRVDNSGNLTNIGNITGTGAITVASTGAGNDIIIDGADQFIVQDAAVFNTDVDMVFNDLENLSISGTISGTTSVSVWNMSIANNTSSGTQNLALLQNAGGTGVTDALLVLDNADADTAVSAGIVVTSSAAGGVTTAIDVSHADITNALLFGANDVIGTNFTIAGASGAVTGGTYNGQTITSTANFTGSLSVATTAGIGTAATSSILTIQGSAGQSEIYIQGNSEANIAADGSMYLGFDANNDCGICEFAIYNDGTTEVFGITGSNARVRGSITSGTAALQGSLVLNDGDGQTATISVGSALAANTALAVPTAVGAADTFCLLTLANCAGAGGGVTTPGGTTNRLAVFTGSQTLGDSWFLQNGSTLELDNTRNLSLVGGNLSVTGNADVNGNFTITSAASGSRVIAGRFNDDFGGTGASTYFQNSNTNENTYLNVAANGTGTTSGIILHGNAFDSDEKGVIEYVESTGLNISATNQLSNDGGSINLNTKPGSGGSLTTRLTIDPNGVTTFNPTGTDSDLIIQGDTNANLFYVDAGADRIGIGDATPDAFLDVAGSFQFDGNGVFGDAAGDTLTINGTAVSIPNNLNFDSNTLFIDSTNNRVGIGDATPDAPLDVEPTGAVTAASYGQQINNLQTNATTDGINKHGLHISSTGTFTGGAGAATNNYGLYIAEPTGGDNNYAINLAGATANDFLRMNYDQITLSTNAYLKTTTITNAYDLNIDTDEQITFGESNVSGNLARLEVNINDGGNGAAIEVNPQSSTQIGAIVRGAASQSADLLQFQNSSGVAMLMINPSGQLVFEGATDDANELTIAVADPTVGDATITIPNVAGVSDTFCLLTLANCGGSGVSTIGTLDSQTKSANGAVITGTSLVLQTADATFPGLVSTGTQTFAGAKTFNSQITAAAGINLGTQTLLGTTAVINFDNFDVASTGSVTVGAQQTITMVGGTTAQRPVSPTEGMMYFDATTDQLLTYANGKWQGDRTTATKIVAASNSSQAAKDAADYVADGTGDQTEINAALTAASGGVVYLLPGTYTVSASVSIPDNTTLAGAGRGTIVQLADLDVGINMIRNTSEDPGTGVVVRDMRLDGRNDLNTAGEQIGVYFINLGDGTNGSAVQGGRATGLWIEDFRNEGIFLWQSDNTVVSNNVIQNSGGGVKLYRTSSNNTITGNRAQGNTGRGFFLEWDGMYNTITDNTAQSNGTEGFYIYDNSSNNTITSNNAYSNGTSGFTLAETSVSNTLTGNNARDNTEYGIFLAILSPGGTEVGGTAVTGNTVTGNGQGGIELFRSNDNTVSGNKIHDNGGATLNRGIGFDNADDNTITGNNITDTSCTTTCYAINISNSTSSANYLSDNTLDTGTINDVGTRTIYGGQLEGGGNYAVRLSSASTTGATQQGLVVAMTDTGVVTTGTDTTYGQQLSVTRTGATGGTINTTGLDISVTGSAGGTSTVTGLNVSVQSADTNYAAIFQGGNVGIGDTTPDALLDVAGSFQFDGNGVFGDASSDTVTFNAEVASHIIPDVDDTYDLGSATNRWRDLYLGPASLHIGTNGDEGIISYNTGTNTFQFNQAISTPTFRSDTATFGVASATNGVLTLQNATNAFTVSLSAPDQTVGNATITLPDTAGVDDVFCLMAVNNCGVGSGVTTIGTINSQTKSANGAVISGTSLVLQTADITFPGLVSTGTQTFAGAKTFNGAVTASAAGTGLSVTNDANIGGALSVTGNGTFTGSVAVNGGNITSTGALNITPGGTLTLGVTGQAAVLQGSTTTISSTGAGNDITLNSADATIFQNSGTTVASLNNVGGLELLTNGYNLSGIAQSAILVDGTITKDSIESFYAFNFNSTINVNANPTIFGTDFLFRDWSIRNINATSGTLTDDGGHTSFGSNPNIVGTGNNNSTTGGVTGLWSSFDLDKTGTGTLTVTNAYSLLSTGDVGDNTSVTNRHGVRVNNVTASGSATGTVGTQYGLYVENLTRGTSDYGLYIAGADTNAIWVDSGTSRFDGIVDVQGGSITNSVGALSIQSATTNAITLDSGTTGAVNVGTGASVKTVTIGNTTGASAVTIQAGTGAINIGTTAQARTTNIATGAAAQTVTIGSTSGASSLTLQAGTGAINIGATNQARTTNIATGAAAQTVTVGSTNTTSSLTLQSGSGALNVNSGTGTINIGSTASARSINIGTGAAAQTLTMGSTTGTSLTTIQGGTDGIQLSTAGGVNIGNGSPDPGFDLSIADVATDTQGSRLFFADKQLDVTTGSTTATPFGVVTTFLHGDISAGADLAGAGGGDPDGAIAANNSWFEYTLGSGSTISGFVQGYRTNLVLDGGGTVDNYAAYAVNTPDVTTTTLTNFYGLFIDSIGAEAVNGYGIYQEGTGDENYFGGTIELETFNNVSGSVAVCRDTTTHILGNCASVAALKDNIDDLSLGLDAINLLTPRQYNWKSNGNADFGFVAEEVEAVNPLLAQYDSNGELVGVKYMQMSALLVQGVQELDVKVNENTAQIASVQVANDLQDTDILNLSSQSDALSGQVAGLQTGQDDIEGQLSSIQNQLNSGQFASLNVSGHSTFGDLTVTGTATVNNLVVTNATVTESLTVNGHIITGNTAGTTTATPGSASCDGTVTVSGNDTAGTITIQTGAGGCAPGIMTTVDFAADFDTAPRVILTPANAGSASVGYFAGTTNNASFTIDAANAPANSTTYIYNYHVMQ